MTITIKILLFTGLLAYYYFVLRKYNSLGFRMFSLFGFVAIAVVYWWYEGYQELKSLQKNGVQIEGVVTKKSIERGEDSNVPDNIVGFTFVNSEGKTVQAESCEFTSKEEYEAVSMGQKVPIVYDPSEKKVQMKTTFDRSMSDYNYILVFPAILLLTGLACLVFLRKYKVQAHESTVYEYLTDESGKVVFDDKQSEASRAIKKVNLFSKLMQMFGK